MSDEPTKHPGGRPKEKASDKVRLPDIQRLAELGLTDAQIGYAIGVTEQTINNWKSDEQFLLALKKGKEISDERVVRSLFERAIGYSHPDVHISNYQGQITVTDITKHYPPDPTSCIFWLKNRRKEEWKDVHKLEHGGTINFVEQLTDEQIEQRIAKLLAESGINDGLDKAIARVLCQAGVNTSQ